MASFAHSVVCFKNPRHNSFVQDFTGVATTSAATQVRFSLLAKVDHGRPMPLPDATKALTRTGQRQITNENHLAHHSLAPAAGPTKARPAILGVPNARQAVEANAQSLVVPELVRRRHGDDTHATAAARVFTGSSSRRSRCAVRVPASPERDLHLLDVGWRGLSPAWFEPAQSATPAQWIRWPLHEDGACDWDWCCHSWNIESLCKAWPPNGRCCLCCAALQCRLSIGTGCTIRCP